MALRNQNRDGNGVVPSYQPARNGRLPANHTEINGLDGDTERSLSRSQNGSYGSISSPRPSGESDHSQRNLTYCQWLSYGVGHVLNDLTASMWFSYLLVFLHQVNEFHNILAGNLMLIGQVSDALCTPFIGFESDRTKGFWKLGRRKTWHLVGTLCVLASFAFLFTKCITCSHAPDIAQFVYYAPFVVIFQFGWAATQISHLSFSSDLTPYKHERVTLQSIRNFFTVIANLSVYGIFALLFYVEGGEDTSDDLGPADAPKFQTLALICLGMGVVFNFIFYAGTTERSSRNSVDADRNENSAGVGDSSIEQSTVQHSKMTWRCWLKEHQFYQIAVLYMAVRLYINVSQVYFPMYLTETVALSKQSIALLPLVTYCASFLMSFCAPFINRLLGRKLAFVVGAAIGGGSSTWMYFISKHSNDVYGTAVLMGAAGSLLLITSLSMTSDLISANTESGAFVFGAMSFTDKLSNGVAVLLIQKFHPCVGCCPLCEPYYRNVQCFIPGGALIIGFVALLTLVPQDIGTRRKSKLVVAVMGNPVSVSPSVGSHSDTYRCSCGALYSPPSTCPVCGEEPQYQTKESVTHRVQVHNYDTDDDDDDDDQGDYVKKPLLGGKNINTPPGDIEHHSDNGSIPKV